MFNLSVDIGNSFSKAALFDDERLIETWYKLSSSELLELINKDKKLPVTIASVGKELVHIQNLIDNKDRLLILDSDTPVPIKVKYLTPHSLGMDRLAACIGAKTLFNKKPILKIDTGTCITFDFVNAEGEYEGGSISLGLKMRFKALNHFTAKLPFIESFEDHPIMGVNTNEAIVSGVVNGIIAEMDSFINYYQNICPNLEIVICGGDSDFFESKLKQTIFVVPHLVMLGLNRVYLYHVQKN